MLQNLLSAAVVIGALMLNVNPYKPIRVLCVLPEDSVRALQTNDKVVRPHLHKSFFPNSLKYLFAWCTQIVISIM